MLNLNVEADGLKVLWQRMQTSDIRVERVASLCSPDAVQVGARLQELLSGSELIDPVKGGAGNVGGISMVPAVSLNPTYCLPPPPL